MLPKYLNAAKRNPRMKSVVCMVCDLYRWSPSYLVIHMTSSGLSQCQIRTIYWTYVKLINYLFRELLKIIQNWFQWVTNYYSMIILSTNKAVDTFFFMSALLLTWSMLKQLRNKWVSAKPAIDIRHSKLCLEYSMVVKVNPLAGICPHAPFNRGQWFYK